MKNIELKSRYGDIHILKHLEGNMYSPICKNGYMRIIGKDPIHAIDFDGGPYLAVGDTVKEKKIKSINMIESGIILILE